MKKSMIMISALLAVAVLATSAFSWSPGRGCRGSGQGGNFEQGGGCGGNDWNSLTKEQKDELAALRQKFIDETYETRAAMMNKHQELRMLMETSSPDRTKLTTLSQEVTDLRKQMLTKGIDFALAAKKIAPEINAGDLAGCGRGKGGRRGCPGQSSGCPQ